MRDARLETFVDELGITRTRWSSAHIEDEPVEPRREVKGQPTPPIQPDGRWDGRMRVTRGDRAEATNDHAALASWMSRTKVV